MSSIKIVEEVKQSSGDIELSKNFLKQRDEDDNNSSVSNYLQEGSLYSQPMHQAQTKRGRRSTYQGALFPDLIDKAKLILPSVNYSLEKILEMEEFKVLQNSSDIPRFLSKFILNQATKRKLKSVKEVSLKFSTPHNKGVTDTIPSKTLPIIQDNPEIQPFQGNELPSKQINLGAKIQSEITSNYLREFMIIPQTSRFDFISQIFRRNSQSLSDFLINLKITCPESHGTNMFRMVYDLNLQSNATLQIKSRLFVISLLYYNYEIIEVEPALLQNAMVLLATRPNSEQALGLANYIFLNEPDSLSQYQNELLKFDSGNIGVVQLMMATFNHFKIDSQVIRLLPNTLMILNRPFIQLIKEDQGLRLIKDVPIPLVRDFIYICSLSQAASYSHLDSFITKMNELFVTKWDFIEQEDFQNLYNHISLELKERNPRWLGNLNSISSLAEDFVHLSHEKGCRGLKDLINDLMRADFTQLHKLMALPSKAEDLNSKDLKKLVEEFLALNRSSSNKQVIAFANDEHSFDEIILLREFQASLGFDLLSQQKFCLNLIQSIQSKFVFVNFGIGNGKTLLCTSLAAIFSLKFQQPIFVIGKNDHLILRDEKNFGPHLRKIGLEVNVNQYQNQKGVYYLTQKSFAQCMLNETFKEIWMKSRCILDEFDWILFEGSVSAMNETIEFIKLCQGCTSFTGSTLNEKEKACLSLAFEAEEIRFPNINSIMGDKRVDLGSQVIVTTQQDYFKAIFSLCQAQVHLSPVVIVASNSYSILEANFKKYNNFPFYSLRTMKGIKVEASIERSFEQRNQRNQYGVFLMTEQQGRGTDLRSNKDIELSGGLFVIVADLFSERSYLQIIGRVGRLQKKGQFTQVVFKQGSQLTFAQERDLYWHLTENQSHQKLSQLQSLLSSKSFEDNRTSNQNEESQEMQIKYESKDLTLNEKDETKQFEFLQQQKIPTNNLQEKEDGRLDSPRETESERSTSPLQSVKQMGLQCMVDEAGESLAIKEIITPSQALNVDLEKLSNSILMEESSTPRQKQCAQQEQEEKKVSRKRELKAKHKSQPEKGSNKSNSTRKPKPSKSSNKSNYSQFSSEEIDCPIQELSGNKRGQNRGGYLAKSIELATRKTRSKTMKLVKRS